MNVQKYLKEYSTLAASIAVFVIGLCLYIAGYKQAGNVLFGIISLWVVIRMVFDMAKAIARKQYGLDILAVVAILSALALGEYLASIVIVLMLASGQALEEYAQARARTELNDLLKRAPKIAHLKIDGSYKDIAVDQIAIGDELLVKPGEVFPVDAEIIEGTTTADESALTGESMPVDKTVGSSLLSGSINQQSSITIRALKTSRESQYEQIVALVANAASSKSPFVRLADTYSIPFTITAFTIAGLAWLTSGDPVRALEVLVVATPCPLLIATPVAIVSGMSRAARGGIIMKDGAALEVLGKLRAIAFDKTGTLTRGTPAIKTIEPHHENYDEDALLQIAATLESESAHILARAVTKEAQKRKLELLEMDQLNEVVGGGISAEITGAKHLIGKASYISSMGIDIPDQIDSADGETAIYIANHIGFIGTITFSDTIRPEARKTISRLRAAGIKHIMMLTGDKKMVAERIAHKLGITNVKAECLPADKLTALADFRKKYSPLAFAGDGINDAPSLAAADVGIALGAKGSTAASEAADVVIMLDDFSKVADAVDISKRSIRIAKQSIFVGIGLSVVLMLAAGISGVISPVYGALLQEAVDVVVILNALRAHR